MTLSRLRSRLVPVSVSGDGEEGSLILVLLVLLIASGLSILLIGETVRQAVATRYDAKHVRTLNSAEAGLEVALGQIRASYTVLDPMTNKPVGKKELLPCGPLTGRIGSGATATYSVAIKYVDSAGATIGCTPGSGTAKVPDRAFLVADGSDVSNSPGQNAAVGARTLRSTYIFTTTNANVPGGLIHVFDDATAGHKDLCLDAGSDMPAVGDLVTLQVCTTGAVKQRFAYQTNLGIVLTSTIPVPAVSGNYGMCATAAAASTLASDVAGTRLTMTKCTSATTLTASQIWSFNDFGSFQATDTTGTKVGTNCFVVSTPNTVGSPVSLANNCGNPYDSTHTWVPDAQVGAGAAGSQYVQQGVYVGTGGPRMSGQLVNYKEFGRCFDVNGLNVNSTYMIAYPCKQKPNYNDLTWNQLITSQAPNLPKGMLVIYQNSDVNKPYCLTSTLTPDTTTGSLVTLTPCPTTGTAPKNMTWSFTPTTATYASNYTIKDGAGNCLDLLPVTTKGVTAYSQAVVNTCSASLSQKWNAPPGTIDSNVVDFVETYS